MEYTFQDWIDDKPVVFNNDLPIIENLTNPINYEDNADEFLLIIYGKKNFDLLFYSNVKLVVNYYDDTNDDTNDEYPCSVVELYMDTYHKKLYYNEINDYWVIPLIIYKGILKNIDFEDEYIRKNIQYKFQYNSNNNDVSDFFFKNFYYKVKKNRKLCRILSIKPTNISYLGDINFDVNIHYENKIKKISSKMLDYKILKWGFEILYLIPLNPLIVTFKSLENILMSRQLNEEFINKYLFEPSINVVDVLLKTSEHYYINNTIYINTGSDY